MWADVHLDLLAFVSIKHRATKSAAAANLFCGVRHSSCFIGHVLAMMAPWNEPFDLTRIWCAFELYTANEDQVDVTIVMPPAQPGTL